MKNISEIFGRFYGLKPSEGDVGIEIETETMSPGDYPKGFLVQKEHPMTGLYYWEVPMKFWEGHKDGSLRNFGVEFVLKKPLTFAEVREALNEFKESTKEIKFVPSPPSTSVHVHLNFSKRTLLEIGNFLTLWMMFENILVEFCGETRRSNLFALPCRVAEGVCSNITEMFIGVEGGVYQSFARDPSSVKYGAVNIATLSSIGSVELRCFRGTTSSDEIQEWVDILEELYKFSLQPGLTPPDIIQAYRDSELDFFHNVFVKTGKRLAGGLNIIAYIERNLWYAVDIASSVNDWLTIGDAIPTSKAKARAKPNPPMALDMLSGDFEQFYSNTPVPDAVVNPQVVNPQQVGVSTNAGEINWEIMTPSPNQPWATHMIIDDIGLVDNLEEEDEF